VTRANLAKTILDSLGLPNSQNLAALLGTISNVDLRTYQLKMIENEGDR
jgi:hypothetical protein